jgi:protein O-GlcNAc transferase
MTLLAHGEFFAAVGALERALLLNGRLLDAVLNLGEALRNLNRSEEAAAVFRRALAIEPNQFEALLGLGKVCASRGERGEAAKYFSAAQKLRLEDPAVAVQIAALLEEIGYKREALAALTESVAAAPRCAALHGARGALLHRLGQLPEAVDSYERAIAIDQSNPATLLHRGWALDTLGLHSSAIGSFKRVLALDPSSPVALSAIMDAASRICDWTTIDAALESLRTRPGGIDFLHPCLLLAIGTDAAEQLRCSSRMNSERVRGVGAPIWTGRRYEHGRIRVAYISADFYEHATMYLMAGLFEEHDRDRFETIAVSLRSQEAFPAAARVRAAFDRFVDVSALTDTQAAKLLADLEVDIAVDLKGYTQGHRARVLAHRVAPIQVNYLGFPGTMGAPHVDYIIADSVLIPDEHRVHYSEQVVHLPNSYQANDRKRPIAEKVFSRAELGLPPAAFVFCCFNNNFKISRSTFDGWMRILNQVENSVLWLLEGNKEAAGNLCREAETRGVKAARLIFAERLPLPQHLARHRAADLFIDTSPCNAHTTASDALWAGLPVLTCIGETFASRVAASLLNAIGMPELIATTQEQYEAMAIELATDPGQLLKTREKLDRNRLTAALFDTERFTRHIENAYEQMFARYQADLDPAPIVVR